MTMTPFSAQQVLDRQYRLWLIAVKAAVRGNIASVSVNGKEVLVTPEEAPELLRQNLETLRDLAVREAEFASRFLPQ